DAVDAAVDRARLLVGETRVRPIETELPLNCIGAWDRARTVRALRALITNALQYGDRDQAVRIVGGCDGGRVRVAISGGGAGPTADELGHLFERFYRGPSAAETGEAGSGLGL